MAANFNKLLDAAGFEITQSLNEVYSTTLNKLKETFYDSKEDVAIKKEIANKELLVEKMNKEITDLRHKQKGLRPMITPEQKRWLSDNGYSTRETTQPEYEAIKQLHGGVEQTNIKEFKRLKSTFERSMNLAVGAKEQRQVLFKFYSLDWKSLGIEVPPDLDFANIKIEDGKIISDSSKLLN